MKTSQTALAVFVSVVALAAQADIGSKDKEFIQKAAVGGMYEVEAGGLAQSKGSSERIKSFGAMLVKDHSAANEELKTLAARKSVAIPSVLPQPKKQKLERLSAHKNFDKAFVDEVGIADHAEDIRLFEKASVESEDAEIKDFAKRTLPTLKAHREHAAELKRSSSN